MKILEFCGNPGCGKSTVGALLLEELLKDGSTAFDYNQIKEKSKIRNLRYILSAQSLKMICSLLRFGSLSHISKKTLVYSVKIAVIVEQIKRWSQKGDIEYLLFDEGIIQYLTTLFHNKRITSEISIPEKCLGPFYGSYDITIINCSVDINENIRRLNNRNRSNDRFVMGDANAQKAALELKQYNIDTILSGIDPEHVIRIDTADSHAAVSSIIREI